MLQMDAQGWLSPLLLSHQVLTFWRIPLNTIGQHEMNYFYPFDLLMTLYFLIGNPRKPSNDHSAKQSLDDPKANRKGRKGNSGQTGVDI